MSTDPTPDLTSAIYGAFQRTHRFLGLQHAQIRALLADHLARVLLAVLVPATDRAGVSAIRKTMTGY